MQNELIPNKQFFCRHIATIIDHGLEASYHIMHRLFIYWDLCCVEKIAVRMQLKPGAVDEYKRQHDAIWPDLAKLLSEHGICDYSIFLDETDLSLFAVLKLAPNNRRSALPSHPLMRQWWQLMAPLMEVEADMQPKEQALVPVFHLA